MAYKLLWLFNSNIRVCELVNKEINENIDEITVEQGFSWLFENKVVIVFRELWYGRL